MENTKTYGGKAITTFREVDEVFHLEQGTAKAAFMEQKSNFVQNDDFAYIARKEYHNQFTPNERLIGNPNGAMIILFESGLMKLMTRLNLTADETDDEPAPTVEKADHDLTVFTYEGYNVRTILINGEPWWVLKDVCMVLNIANVTDTQKRLDEDEKGLGLIETLGGNQKVLIINESGLYNVILRSDKPEAKAFKRWVTHEVLPAIRKTGSYSQSEEVKIDIREVETLTKKDYLVIITALSKASNEALPYIREVLSKLAPSEFQKLEKEAARRTSVVVTGDIGKQIFDAMTESGLSQKKLAKMCGCASSSISNYVNGKTKPCESVVKKIADVLNITIN